MPVSLNSEALDFLQEKKNLLAFSGGTDSSALFHLLHQHNIAFDIIHVNYNTRSQSHDEQRHALELAQHHQKKCFTKNVSLASSNFEHTARTLRYDFFHEVMVKNCYNNLITAHQLNDRLEWFLMQLCKGSGLNELLGMQSVEQREHYRLIRPILHVDSETIHHYLNSNNITYFIDESNSDQRFKRNRFREQYATALIKESAPSIAKSFEFLTEDLSVLFEPCEILHVNELSYFKLPTNRRSIVITIDKILKQRGYLMGQNEKNRLKSENSLVVGRTFIVAIDKAYCFIAPYVTTVMNKPFKEQCRIFKIEPKLRGYLYRDNQSFKLLLSLPKS